MARSDWDIHGIIVYMDDSSNIMDIYEYAERKSKYIPIDYIAGLLTLSDQRFVDMLNEPADSKKHLITSAEEEFRNSDWYFSKYQVFSWDCDLTVELADFEYWLDDNYDLLKENRATPKEDCSLPDTDAMQARIAELEAENAKLKERVAELENAALQGREAGKSSDGEEFPAEYEDHGIFTMVAKLVDARAPVAEIMAALDDEQEFLSQRENGYFFHPNPAGKSPFTLRNSVKNTLKKRVAKGS